MTGSRPDIETGASEPELVSVHPATTAVIRGVVAMADLRNFFDRSFRMLAETISTQGVDIVSPAFGLYRGHPGDTVDLEVGFVTDPAIRPEDEVIAGSLPGGHVARAVHVGGFDGLGSSWERLRTWIQERGLAPGTARWEFYVTEPSPEMDPCDLRTELNWPVAD
ncbi:GyrI-like domain-containing protein [Pseudonocardia asaccharolytica]|uniref:Transcriptional regulator n=1 Tax=Pseudonocardia asaccharolytica DSM 44247 = NBRC 16224 TaxID=1123024 RepID=A0A511CUE4_9PSEU|nr:GyrI-like domain-containing protein [Pseudonocardia asaccharolytica]GEL16199.1 transcriptional regulator [Pseudonocardia asaccharolytica DSM 44247 = NBRC 16224]